METDLQRPARNGSSVPESSRETPLACNALGTGSPGDIADSWPTPCLAAAIEQDRAFWTGKRALVTGAFGFVGGHLARALDAAGARVTALDANTRPAHGSQIDLAGLRARLEIVEADITDRAAMQTIVHDGRFDFIFHLAAGATTVEKAMHDPYATILANTMGYVNIAEAARLLPADQRPVLLYSSTDKVYGESDELPYDEEKSDLRGVGVYDAAKLAADIFSSTYHRALGLNTIVLRMCNVFGPYDFNTSYRLIPKAMRAIFHTNEAPELYYGSLHHHRDYIYVEDVARAFMALAREPKCRGLVFNLPGVHYSSTPDILRDVLDTVAAMQDEARANGDNPLLAKLVWNRYIRLLRNDSGVVAISKQHLNGTKIKNVAGFCPSVSFQDGLRRTILFYLGYYNQTGGKAGAPAAPASAAALATPRVAAPAAVPLAPSRNGHHAANGHGQNGHGTNGHGANGNGHAKSLELQHLALATQPHG